MHESPHGISAWFLREFGEGRLSFNFTESGYERFAVQALPDGFSKVTLLVHVVWFLAAVAAAWTRPTDGELLWLLAIPGVALAFLVASFFPLPWWLAVPVLLLALSQFSHWLQGDVRASFS